MTKHRWKQASFLLPGMLGAVVFFALPLCYCLLFSFSGTFGSFHFSGVRNYSALFGSAAFRLALGNTFLMLILFVAVTLALAVGLVYFLNNTPRSRLGLLICSVTMFLPSALIVNVAKEFPTLCETFPRVLFFLIFLWKQLGINTLILQTSAGNMDPALLEAAAVDGAKKRTAFFRISFFYLLPQVKFLVVLDTICFFRMFRESYLLYGYYPPDAVYMMQNFFFNNFQRLNYQRLSAGATVTVVLLLALNFLIFRGGERHEFV